MAWNRLLLAFITISAAALVALVWPGSFAHACGGCFGPQGQPSVVRAHRMALMITETETTLWDQFEYTGEPEDFVWVLPVRGTQDVDVDISDDVFFQSLTERTQITLQAPSAGGGGGGGFGCAADSGAVARAGAESDAVTVYRQEVVGPYETVVIGSDMGTSLLSWLQDREYAVSDSLLPMIESYVEQDFNFLALRLAPDAGVSRMQPVRVTAPGENRALPLRMVAAGVGSEVSLELFVFADRRYETSRFANVEVDRDALTYDRSADTFNYDALAEEALETEGGRAWLTEFAGSVPAWWRDTVIYDEDGEAHDAVDDWDFVFAGLGEEVYLTRMRAQLPTEALEEDLVLQPSFGSDLPTRIFVSRVVSDGDEEVSRGAALPPPIVMVSALAAAALGVRRIRRRRQSRAS
jgi:hypothetical protein